MTTNYQYGRKKLLKKALEDHENYHSSLEHGADVEKEYLNKYGFNTLEDALEWAKTPVSKNFDHTQDRALEILIITEKGTMAREVARLLSNNRYYRKPYMLLNQDRDNEYYYHFKRKMYGKFANIWVTTTAGHLKTQVIDEEDDEEYIQEEGEAIGFECIDYLLPSINVPPSGNKMDAFYRGGGAMGILALSRFEITFDLLPPAAKYRKKELLPKKFIEKLSFYPCGTICVKLVVDRYEEVQNSDKQYCLEFEITIHGENIVFSFGVYTKNEAERLCQKLNKFKYCEVIEVTKSEALKEQSPAGLNTFELLKFLSKYFFLDTTAGADISQWIYQFGLSTYPRTESTKYSKDLKVNVGQLYDNLSKLNFQNPEILKAIKDMEINVEKVLDKGEDFKDHPPITPTEKRLKGTNELNYDNEIVYDFIVRRFLASFADDYQYCKETIKFKIGEEDEFQYSYFTTENPGFTTLLPELIKDGTRVESLFVKVGSELPFKVKTKEIEKPLMKEFELVQVMEENHIGTDGTIPTHIENMAKNGFVKINQKTFEFQPEPLGLLLAKAYDQCIPELVKPRFRARFDADIKSIGCGDKTFVEIV
uniref:DNA topoisomerase n=1 Tax=Panagrolaimus sp. ES5 TaxID=591445 RepID=A0AC34FAS4_9BILA